MIMQRACFRALRGSGKGGNEPADEAARAGKAPSSKSPSSREDPSAKIQLEFGHWSFSGAWCLVLGAFSVPMRAGRTGVLIGALGITRPAYFPRRMIGPSALGTPPLRSREIAKALTEVIGCLVLNERRASPVRGSTVNTPPSTGSLYCGSTTQSW